METLTAAKWSLCLDNDGRVLDQYTIRKIAFHEGISDEIRPEVWLFLLGYYPFNSTSDERRKIDDEKRTHYNSMLTSWSSVDFLPTDDFTDYARLIDKDSMRTDRSLDFFSDVNIQNVFTLERILKTFVILRPEIGYVQGMSDVLALPLMVLNNEHQAFWCFDSIMKTVGTVFSDLTLSVPLENLAKLCHHIDRPLYDHLNVLYEGEHWLFSYRWILLNFKRELTVKGASRLWECFWSCHATKHFPLLFTASVLFYFRDTLLQHTDFEQLMQFSQSVRGKIPVTLVLSNTISLLEQLKTDDYCPYDIKFLVSNEVSAPPPLVGFVRARQKVTSLYSNKIEIQRHQIWKSLFGDTPVQSITSPFMLTSATFSSENHANKASTTTCTPNIPHPTTSSKTRPISTTELTTAAHVENSTLPLPIAPPKMGFVPRENTIHLRDDIRWLQLTNIAMLDNKEQNKDNEQLLRYEYSTANVSASDRLEIPDSDDISSYNYIHIPDSNGRGYSTVRSFISSIVDGKSDGWTDPDSLHQLDTVGNTCSMQNSAEVPSSSHHSVSKYSHSIATPHWGRYETCPTNRHTPHTQYTRRSTHGPFQHHENANFNFKANDHSGRKCFTRPPPTGASTILSSSGTDKDVQFDNLRSEAELTCY